MNIPTPDETLRRQLTPLVVTLVQRLQDAQAHATSADVMMRKLTDEAKVLLTQQAEARLESEGIAKQMAAALSLANQLQELQERMLKIPAEPHQFWRGLLLGCFMGSTFGLAFAMYILRR